MKIAIPIADGKLCQHFGHCDRFALIEVDLERKILLGRMDLEPPPHEPGLLPPWVAAQGAEVVIAGGMGQRAQALFQQNGIRVIVGAPAEAPGVLADRFLAGTLVQGVNVCDH